MRNRKLYTLCIAAIVASSVFTSSVFPSSVMAGETPLAAVGTVMGVETATEEVSVEAASPIADAVKAQAAAELSGEEDEPASEDTDASAQAEDTGAGAQAEDSGSAEAESSVSDSTEEPADSGEENPEPGGENSEGNTESDSSTESQTESHEDENPAGDTDSSTESQTESHEDENPAGDTDSGTESQTESHEDENPAGGKTDAKPAPAVKPSGKGGKTPSPTQKPAAKPTGAPSQAPTASPTPTTQPQTSSYSSYVGGTGSYAASGTKRIPAPPYTAGSFTQKMSAGMRKKMVAYAEQFITVVSGVPYVWGGEDLSTGVDCSGFTQQIYKAFNISIPRTSAEQAECGRVVEFKDAKPGDLLFKAKGDTVHHVMMVTGNDTKNRVLTVVEAKGSAYGIVNSEYGYDNPSLYSCNRYFDTGEYKSTQAADIAKDAERAKDGDEKARKEMLSRFKEMAEMAHDETGTPKSVIIAGIISDGQWGLLPDEAVKSNNILRVKAEKEAAVEDEDGGSDKGREDAESENESPEDEEGKEGSTAAAAEEDKNPHWDGKTVNVKDDIMQMTADSDENEKAKAIMDAHGAAVDGGMESDESGALDSYVNPLYKDITRNDGEAPAEESEESEYRIYEDVENAIADAVAMESAQFINEEADGTVTAEDYLAAMKADESAAEKADALENVITEFDLTQYDASGAIIGAADGTDYTDEDIELIWAIVAQEDDGSYEGALAVISTAMNRADVNYGGYGTTAYEQLTANGQFCYSPQVSDPSLWQARLGGNVPDDVKKAVEDCLKDGMRNHSYLNFRSTQDASGERVQIGSNWFF